MKFPGQLIKMIRQRVGYQEQQQQYQPQYQQQQQYQPQQQYRGQGETQQQPKQMQYNQGGHQNQY